MHHPVQNTTLSTTFRLATSYFFYLQSIPLLSLKLP